MTAGYLSQYRQLICEFLRFILIGGIAFIIDFCVLYLSKTFLFYSMGHIGILLAAAFGFTTALIFNYIFSIFFVFEQIDENAKKNKIRSFVLFVTIGFMGLVITEICMYSGVYLFGENWYLIVKIFTSGIVLFWNYLGRKLFIFKGAKPVQE